MSCWTKSKALSTRLAPLASAVQDAATRVQVSEERRAESVATAQKLKATLRSQDEARSILQLVARRTQEQLAIHLGGVTTLAMGGVFPDEPYSLRCEFVVRRGRTECDLSFQRGEHAFDPLSESGGGAVDVASFALRVALWSLAKTRPVLLLDEPFRFLHGDRQLERASQLLQEVSHRMGLQLIVTTADPRLEACADRVFAVRRVQGVSEVVRKV